jgi:hypothetical protein
MFRFWAGATAGFFVGSLGVSGVFAAEFGSSLTPLAGSQTSAAYFLAAASFSSGNSSANSWGVASGAGLVKTAEPQTTAFVDLAASSTATAGWSTTTLLENAKSIATPTLTEPRTGAGTYLGVVEALSKQSLTTARSSASFVVPTSNGFGAENNGVSRLLR